VHCAECPVNFTYIAPVNGCYQLVTHKLNWTSAGQECRSLHKDAHLLVINDADEQWSVAGMMESMRCKCIYLVFVCLSELCRPTSCLHAVMKVAVFITQSDAPASARINKKHTRIFFLLFLFPIFSWGGWVVEWLGRWTSHLMVSSSMPSLRGWYWSGWQSSGGHNQVFQQASRFNSVPYSQWDGKWVPAKVRWWSTAAEQRQASSCHLWINVWVAVTLCDPRDGSNIMTVIYIT